MPMTQVKKWLRISKTTKLGEDKFCLCLFPDPKLPLLTQKGVELEMVREHLLAQGGAIDRTGGNMKPGQGLFVRDFVDDDEEDVVVESTNKEQCTYKKCLLFPLSLLPDKVIMEFADRTGQQEHYSLFGADHGTPSVLSEFGGQREDTAPQNSTSAGLESSLDLHLTDEISVIEAPNGDFDPEEIEEQDLSKADEVEDSCSEDEGESTLGSKQQKKSVDLDSSALSSEISSRQQKSLNATKQASKSREEAGEVDEGQLDQTFADNEISSFSLASKRTRMKAKPNETTTQCIGKKE